MLSGFTKTEKGDLKAIQSSCNPVLFRKSKIMEILFKKQKEKSYLRKILD